MKELRQIIQQFQFGILKERSKLMSMLSNLSAVLLDNTSSVCNSIFDKLAWICLWPGCLNGSVFSVTTILIELRVY